MYQRGTSTTHLHPLVVTCQESFGYGSQAGTVTAASGDMDQIHSCWSSCDVSGQLSLLLPKADQLVLRTAGLRVHAVQTVHVNKCSAS